MHYFFATAHIFQRTQVALRELWTKLLPVFSIAHCSPKVLNLNLILNLT